MENLNRLILERDRLRIQIDEMYSGHEEGCDHDDECMIADNDPSIIAELCFRLDEIENEIAKIMAGDAAD